MSLQDRRKKLGFKEHVAVFTPLAIVWASGMALLGAVAYQSEERTSAMLLDPTFNPSVRWYTGLVGNLGILAWTTAVVAALAGAWICRIGARKNAAKFLTFGGLVGTALLVDHLFQVHSIIIPTSSWIPKYLAQAALIGLVGYWMVKSGREFRRTHTHLIAAAILGLAGSFAIDSIIRPVPGDLALIMEEGAKFLGTLAWATYFVVTSRDICKSVFTDALMIDPHRLGVEEVSVDPAPDHHDQDSRVTSNAGE